MGTGELAERARSGFREFRLYADEPARRGGRDRAKEVLRSVAIGLGVRSIAGRHLQFDYRGFRIPRDLAEMTGAADESWDEIAEAHLDYYRRWAPVLDDSEVLEVGCGVGRDAVRLLERIGPTGTYTGLDVTAPSIRWCQRNITAVNERFRFSHLDVRSPMYNPTGRSSNTDVVLPVPDESVTRIFLHSVFTHMFPDAVAHYLQEFARVLRPEGRVLASFFLVDAPTLAAADADGAAQTFRHAGPDGCRINDEQHPEAAIAYEPDALTEMVEAAGLRVVDVHRGFWSGLHPDAPNGQDIAVLERSDRR